MGSLTLRHYGLKAGDWQTVSAWHEARHGEMLPETILCPLAIIVEDDEGPVAAVFAGQFLGIGIAQANQFLTRPGIGFARARKAGKRILEGLREVLKRADYGLLQCFTECRLFGRVLIGLGFKKRGCCYLIKV